MLQRLLNALKDSQKLTLEIDGAEVERLKGTSFKDVDYCAFGSLGHWVAGLLAGDP